MPDTNLYHSKTTLLPDAIALGHLPILETFPCPYPTIDGGTGCIRIVFPEFTCVCPKTGYPDFAAISLYYLPKNLCVELKSWKLYLNAYRMIGTFHETVTSHLFSTVQTTLDPRWVMLVGDFLPRGNVDTSVVFESDSQRPKGLDILAGQLKPRCTQMGE
jgi:7-cyano-7-deazaguanine reductase